MSFTRHKTVTSVGRVFSVNRSDGLAFLFILLLNLDWIISEMNHSASFMNELCCIDSIVKHLVGQPAKNNFLGSCFLGPVKC